MTHNELPLNYLKDFCPPTSQILSLKPLCSNVFMLKPRVGDIVSIGSPLNLFNIVVLPALSKPLQVIWLRK